MSKAIQVLRPGARWVWNHKIRLAALVLALFLTAPQPVRSEFLDPCCAILSVGLTSITSALTSVVGGGLNAILAVEKGIQDFEKTVVWPQDLINQARGLVQSIQGTFHQIRDIMRIPVNSATLAGPQQLEVNLLSGDANQIGQTSARYTAVYGVVPNAAAASPQTRDLIDMSDAAAEAAMKRAIEIDALAELELQAADRINQSLQAAAPGTAPIIEAQADVWLVRANAYTQSATADLLRVRAIGLANQSSNVKNGAANSAAIQQQILNLLQRH